MDERQTIQTIKDNLQSKVVRSDVFTITPKVAEFMLNLNWPNNRPLMDAVVDRYAAAMSHGHWKLNGESLIMSSDGNMIDGQHRLWAVVSSGAPVRTMITFGVDSNTFDTINSGRARSISYLAKMPPATAAALNFILKLAFGAPESTAQNLQAMAKVYKDEAEGLIKLQSRNVPVLRQAPIIAAGTLWAKAGFSDYVRDMYSNILTLDSGSLPPIGKSFLHQCVDSSTGGRKLAGTDLFVRAFKAFDCQQAAVRRLQYKDGQQTIEQARGMIIKAMKSAGVVFDANVIETNRGVFKKAIAKKTPKKAVKKTAKKEA